MSARALAGAAVLFAGLAACGTPTPGAQRCAPVAPEVLDAVAVRLTKPGVLRNGFGVRSTHRNMSVISAEFVPTGERDNASYGGDILTWMTESQDTVANDYVSLDARAWDLSRWPQPDDVKSLNVTVDGGVASRGCVHARRPRQGGGDLLGSE